MKKFVAILCIFLMGMPAFSDNMENIDVIPTASDCGCTEKVERYEHMFMEKGAISNQVAITNFRNIICKGNAFRVVFDCKLWSECVKAGDKVNFSVPGAIYTQEGTLLIPACSKVVATIIRVEKQRMPNKNARVYMNFDCLLFPDGTAIQMSARPATDNGELKENGWHTAGKLAAYTTGLGILAAGAGTGFAFISHPAALGTAYAISIPIGTTVGLITGLVTPGVKYHAKAGESLIIMLCDDLPLSKQQQCCN